MSVNKLIDIYGASEESIEVNGTLVPVINIPMMSDEEWQQKAKENLLTSLRAQEKAE